VSRSDVSHTHGMTAQQAFTVQCRPAVIGIVQRKLAVAGAGCCTSTTTTGVVGCRHYLVFCVLPSSSRVVGCHWLRFGSVFHLFTVATHGILCCHRTGKAVALASPQAVHQCRQTSYLGKAMLHQPVCQIISLARLSNVVYGTCPDRKSVAVGNSRQAGQLQGARFNCHLP
jgi:hypothetical protein